MQVFATTATLMLLTLGMSLGAYAQQTRVYREGNVWVQEINGSITSAVTVSVRLGLGAVNVRGADQQSVTYQLKKRVWANSEAEARARFDQMHLNARRLGENGFLSAQMAPGNHDRISAELWVNVPRSMSGVKVALGGGSETITDVASRVEVFLGGGTLYMDRIGGAVNAKLGSANVSIGSVGGNLKLTSGGGNVRINTVHGRLEAYTDGGNISIGSASRGVTARTGGGDIQVKHSGGDLNVTTSGGSLDLGYVSGKAFLQTGGGSIRLFGASGPVVASTAGGSVELYNLAQGADVETGMGQITAEFLADNFSNASLRTPSGDIIVYLSSSLKTTVRADIAMANGRRILAQDFPQFQIVSEGGGMYTPKTVYAEGKLNGGGPVLKVRTSSGNIEFRRAARK